METTWKKPFLAHPRRTLLVIVLFALGARLLAGAFFYNEFDLSLYNIPWALGMQDGFFSCYETIKNLNYPPLFPAFLSLIAPLLRWAQEEGVWQVSMLAIKLVPILFDVATLVVLYFFMEKKSAPKALFLAALWAVNPVTFFNSAFWGQADSLLVFFIALTFLAFHAKRPVLGTVLFALGCLAKLQMLYLAPVVLCELFFRYRPKRAFVSLGTGMLTGALGWLPFMLGSGELTLPFRIYFGGFEQYATVNMYAYNFYGAPYLLNTKETAEIFTFGGPTWAQLSLAVTVLLVLFVVFSYWITRKSENPPPAAMTAMLFLNGIFMLTTKQHERYQIPVMILAALCWMFMEDKRMRIPFAAMMVLPFVNEACGLFHMHLGAWFHSGVFLPALVVGSVINVLVFFYMCYLYTDRLRLRKSSPLVYQTVQEKVPAPR